MTILQELKIIYGVTERTLSSMDNLRQNMFVLDRQASHCEECQLMEFAKHNNTVILCLHPHISKY
jgi:recombinational DNA repair protein RecR